MAVKFHFVMRTGPTVGAVYPLESETITIGRDASNTIQINDAEVSRRHARLYFQGGKHILEDVGSTNGTHVNGKRIASPYVLHPGDIISFGEGISLGYNVSEPEIAETAAIPRAAGEAPSPFASTPTPVPPYARHPAGSTSAPPKINPLPIAIGVGVLLFLCACITALWLIDAANLWCTLFPGILRMFGLYCP